MNGFIVGNVKLPDNLPEYSKGCRELNLGSFEVKYIQDKKFQNDKVWEWRGDTFFLLDGVILNLSELLKNKSVDSMPELCEKLYYEKGDTFHEEFIGNYAGLIYEKEKDRLVVFVNKLSSKQVFYYAQNEVFIASVLITDIVETLKQNQIEYAFNPDAAYLMMNYGYMGTDDTFVKEIKKIEAGHQVVFEKKKVKDDCYHRFTNNAYDLSKLSEEEIIDGIDERFRKAIDREYKKDIEGGYKYHYRMLTGGTDSRACAFVSDNLGYKNVTNFTRGVPEHPDEKISRQIGEYLGNNFIFSSNLPLQGNASFLKNIDRTIYESQGLAYYLEVAQSSTDSVGIDETTYGLSHGGSFSEAFLTTGYISEPRMETPTRPLHVYCKLLADKLPSEHLKKYENDDIYSLYSIFFNKHNPTGRNLVKADLNSVFPGLDPDLVAYCLSIPIELRKHYYIYHKWLFTRYPDAAKFKLEKLNARPIDGPVKKFVGRLYRYGNLRQYFRCSKDPLPTWLQKKYNLKNKIKPGKQALMPFDWWYDQNPDVDAYMREYLNKNIDNPVIDDVLRKDICLVYEKGEARQKSMALTVVAATKMFFS